MDITFLTDYLVAIIVGICLCVGYIIKNFLPMDNKYIPLIMGILGTVLNVWLSGEFTPVTLLGGMLSGLASTGMHQLFKQLIEK